MKRILLVVAILVLPSLLYAAGSCEVVGVSQYSETSGGTLVGGTLSGGMVVGGTIVGQSNSPCATVTVKLIERGASRLGGKVTAVFMDGTTKTKKYSSNRISEGETYTTDICWSRKSQLKSMECEF